MMMITKTTKTTNKQTMKKIMLIASAMLVSLTGALHAQEVNNLLTSIEERVAAAKTVKEKASADNWTSRLGEGWKETWRKSTLTHPNDHLVDIYIEKGDFLIAQDGHTLRGVSAGKKQEWLTHIGGKTTLTKNDFNVVKILSTYNPATAARVSDFAQFLSTGADVRGEEYFQFLISNLEVRGLRKPGVWQSALKTDEWFTLASANAHFSPVTFATGRDAIAMRAARLLIEKRKAENLSVEGEEFDAAFAPILDALKAPKFAGLSDACASLGINMELPANTDWTAQEAVAATVIAAAERNGKLVNAQGVQVQYEEGLGSVMFVKGETAYNTWRAETIAND
jgi:hypothetical protein